MKKIATYVLLAWCSLAARADALPAELVQALPQAALSGQATLKMWGFALYQASLWVAPGFDPQRYDQSRFALELRYLRDFQGKDIARRALTEMQHQAGFDARQGATWEQQMRGLFPNVVAGDRLTGVYAPDGGARFYCNGQWLGEIHDAQFARRFFGIWLAPQSSEPALRQALLGTVAP